MTPNPHPSLPTVALAEPFLMVMPAQSFRAPVFTGTHSHPVEALRWPDREVVIQERNLPCSTRKTGRAENAPVSRGGAVNASPLDSNVVQANTLRINFTKEFQEMANLRHPVDIGLENLAFLRHDIKRDFLADDGVVCDDERGILIQFDQAVTSMSRARSLEKAITLAVKQDGVVTRYTQQQFAEAGLSVEPLDAA